MPITPKDVSSGSAIKRQSIEAQQIGNNADLTISAASASADLFGSLKARAKGRIKRIFAGNLTTALTGNATHDIIPRRYPKGCGLAKGALTKIPMLDSPGLRLDSANLAGTFEEVVPGAETQVESALQAPGGANQIKLSAGDTKPDGFYCDADVEIIIGTGKGQKNRVTSYATATKIATLKNLEGTPNWKVATDNTSVARLTTRRYVCDKDDLFEFAEDFTVGAGAAGVDCLAGLEVEFDDNANV